MTSPQDRQELKELALQTRRREEQAQYERFGARLAEAREALRACPNSRPLQERVHKLNAVMNLLLKWP